MRYTTGWVAGNNTDLRVRPRGGHEIDKDLWTVGHPDTDVRVATSRDGTTTLHLIGHCLATATQAREAADTAAAGSWRDAMRLPGSHLTAIRTPRAWWVAGDRAGAVPLFWTPTAGGTLWSTLATPLAALAGTGADLPLLATDLAVTGVDTLAHRSRFETVRRVPPGSLLIIARDNGAERPAHVAPAAFGRTRTSSFEEGAADLRRALTEATSRRARHAEHVTCDFSGGLHSASLACLAATHAPVDAVTFTDDRTATEDDLRHACRVAAGIPGITHHIVHGPTATHFDHLDDLAALPRTDAPTGTLTQLALTDARFTAPTIGGSTTHLTGRGGDTVLRSTPTHLIDLLRDGHRVEALRRITAYARTHRLATRPAIADATKAAARTYPRALSLLANALENPDPRPRRPAPLRWCGTTAAAGWLTPDGRRAAAALVADRAHHACADTRAAELHDRLALERTGSRHATFTQIAHQRWATTVHAPFLDTTVVDVALAVPGPERERPGRPIPLLHAALTGRIPPWLPSRATRTAPAANIQAGLRRNAPALRALIAGSALGRAGLLDPALVLGDLEKAVHGVPAPSTHLRDLIVAEVWLATLDDTRATWWQDKENRAHP